MFEKATYEKEKLVNDLRVEQQISEDLKSKNEDLTNKINETNDQFLMAQKVIHESNATIEQKNQELEKLTATYNQELDLFKQNAHQEMQDILSVEKQNRELSRKQHKAQIGEREAQISAQHGLITKKR